MAQPHEPVGILGISGGSLLLLVHNYGSLPKNDFIPHTALGFLLLVAAVITAYAGVCRILSRVQLFSTLCLTVSALWCATSLVYILTGQGVLESEDLRSSLVPGFAAFALALFVIAGIALLVRNVLFFVIAINMSLACAHQIASLSAEGFGRSAAAANYLLVCVACIYFCLGHFLSAITQRKVELPGTGTKTKAKLKTDTLHGCDEAVSVGVVMNLLSASVLACPLFGVVPRLSVGHVPWLWTAGVFQVGMCLVFYRAMDPLSATFYGFEAVLKFAEGYSGFLSFYSIEPISPIPFPIVFSVLFFVLTLFNCLKNLLEALYHLLFVAYCLAIASQPQGFFGRGSQGVQAVMFISSACMLLITTYNTVATQRVPEGQSLFKALVTRMNGFTLRDHDKDPCAPHLGYSKYADAEVLGHACNVLAAFAMTATVGDGAALSVLVLPWTVVTGGLLQLLCGSVAFSQGKTFEGTVFLLYGVMWTVWGLTRYGGLYADLRGFNVAVGIIGFLMFNLLVMVAALFVNVTWFVYALTFQLIIISFLLDALDMQPYGYDIGVIIIFGLVSFYCFVAHISNSTFQSPQIPLGKPLIRLSGVGGGVHICPHLPAQKATSVQQIADIMKNGGICGMPTDTVYVLVAACNRPDAVVKAYKVKKQAQDRPMSLWLSSLKQLDPVRHLLSPLLLDFMEAAWPSSISMVILKGPWMDTFGLGDAAKHIGTPQSIAIRNPDCSVATHLIDLVGPVAVTSANPTGEPDTTHHNQVYAKLGDKVDGVLCDGPSPENIASTVVDCTKIETGHISFFREGHIPKSKVLQIFEVVQRRRRQTQANAVFETDQLGREIMSSSTEHNSRI
ncbi:uncharacterized protein si:ch211-153b23.4 [Syngnathoides biaculeatus]|uniref:uncharacterized protein si:ch211-153b23.4 n=1 Tax=Syngnathoides biaculeatus TaxID=300417 RepID=UPI002ADE057B|nr:uncharacterized protein si:ch211-153b23.4 [Syngnathoides biaculeatus]